MSNNDVCMVAHHRIIGRKSKKVEGRGGYSGCDKECALCTICKNGKKKLRKFVLFWAVLNGRASQARFKSEQSISASLGMLVYFILFSLIHTQM